MRANKICTETGQLKPNLSDTYGNGIQANQKQNFFFKLNCSSIYIPNCRRARSGIADGTAKPNRRFSAAERRSRFVERRKLAEGSRMMFVGLRRTFEARRKICVEPVFYWA